MHNSGFHGNEMKKTLNSSFETWQILKKNCRNVPWVTLYQIPTSHVDWLKNVAARERGYFAIYGFSENLKNLLLRKCRAYFQIIL